MLYMKVSVPEARNGTAVVEFGSGGSRLATGLAVASASAPLATKHGNPSCDPMRPWGHPPIGGYALLAQGAVPAGCELEYGPHMLVFQPMSGKALEAEAFGRLLLPVYAGPSGKDGRLRPTQGGLRLQQDQFDMLLAELRRDPDASLEIKPLRAPWWQFWKPAPATAPLASEAPRLSAPPLDEASLANLIAGGRRLARPAPAQTDDWTDRDRSSSSSSSSDSSSYSGRGGVFGGAGASGSWDAAGASGVDASGRISSSTVDAPLGAVAVAGAAEVSASDTGTSTNY